MKMENLLTLERDRACCPLGRSRGQAAGRRAGSSTGSGQRLGARKALADPRLLPGRPPAPPAACSVFPRWSAQHLQSICLAHPRTGLLPKTSRCPPGTSLGCAPSRRAQEQTSTPTSALRPPPAGSSLPLLTRL